MVIVLDDDSLFEFAQRCARAYCKKYGCQDQFDDAVGESCAFLLKLKQKGYWETLPDRELKRRTVLALVRWYQDATKKRSKFYRPMVADPIAEEVPDDDDLFERLEREEEFLTFIRRALVNAECVGYIDVIVDVARGGGVADVARKHKAKATSVRSLYKRFLFELNKLDRKRGVKIINAEDATEDEKKSCPLLMTR
jgi:hypothetical protein